MQFCEKKKSALMVCVLTQLAAKRQFEVEAGWSKKEEQLIPLHLHWCVLDSVHSMRENMNDIWTSWDMQTL